ncbi:hypothetical protein PUR29_35080 [Methylobacterium ajmalii]|uniref:Uncharacterized protein n=1 Tax=Methylobacterium ajmalii TaxID=2738439 RepID=A0ABV0A4I3_9HYPH
MRQYRAPSGHLIIGTADVLLATAIIQGFASTGEPIYMGESEVDWDTQTGRTRDGKPIYVCDAGEEWTLDQCVAEEHPRT